MRVVSKNVSLLSIRYIKYTKRSTNKINLVEIDIEIDFNLPQEPTSFVRFVTRKLWDIPCTLKISLIKAPLKYYQIQSYSKYNRNSRAWQCEEIGTTDFVVNRYCSENPYRNKSYRSILINTNILIKRARNALARTQVRKFRGCEMFIHMGFNGGTNDGEAKIGILIRNLKKIDR